MATLKRKTKRLKGGGRTRRRRGGLLSKEAINNMTKHAAKGAVKSVANQVSPHFENIADSIFNSSSTKNGFSRANNLMDAYSQGNLVSSLAATQGLTDEEINKKAIAVTNLLAKLMHDPDVQKAVANIDVAAVGMGANLVNKLEPIVLNTMMKTGNQLSTAGIQTVEGIADTIPGVDDVEGLMQLIYAGTKMVAAGMTTATSTVNAGTAVIGTIGSKGTELANKFDAAVNAASNAIPHTQLIEPPLKIGMPLPLLPQQGRPQNTNQTARQSAMSKKGGKRRRNRSRKSAISKKRGKRRRNRSRHR
jgi:hypothetical protein